MCTTIIVGNGPSVTSGLPYGSYIDDFPEVVRINQFRLTPKEYTGYSVDVWAFANKLQRREKKPYRGLWVRRSAEQIKHCIPESMLGMAQTMELINHETFAEVTERYQRHAPGCFPSTGLVVIEHFLIRYPTVVVHGFDGMVQGERLHYWEPHSYKGHGHVEVAEKSLMDEWRNEGAVITLQEYIDQQIERGLR